MTICRDLYSLVDTMAHPHRMEYFSTRGGEERLSFEDVSFCDKSFLQAFADYGSAYIDMDTDGSLTCRL